MKNTLEKKAVSVCAGIFKFFALSTSASACNLSAYQPEEPKCLIKDK